MKHSLLFWSRKSHCWAGVYLSAVTLLWLGEMALLPAVYEPRFEVASPSPAVSSVGTPAVSVQDVLDRFSHERVDGEPLTPDTVTFLPKEGSWVVRDAGRYVSVTYDVRTGEARERSFDSAKLVEEKNGLAWLSPELGAALNAMLARLEEAFVRLSDFSSDLAHVFRTPVSNLLMQAQVTLARARTEDEYRDVLVSSIEEYERLSGMIADMLFIAQAEEGRLVPNREPLALAALADELADFYQLAAEERGIELRVVGEARVEGDRAMLRRALSNLLANALRHTPAGGEVRLCLSEAHDAVEVTVQNSGTPIPAEHWPYLFDRFYRVDPARQRDGGRTTGLGLAIVKSIVEAHGGQAVVASDAQATRFILRFPVGRAPAQHG